MKKLSKQLKLMVLTNVVFVVLYMFLNWNEYSTLNNQIVTTNFPWNMQFTVKSNSPGIMVEILPNLTLLIFIVAILINLYFLIRLQGASKLE